MIARLPAISLGNECCRLPLAEPTAAALLAVLLDPESVSCRPELADAIGLDPALALWTSYHHASYATSGDASVPAIGELVAWLVEHLSSLLCAADDSAFPKSASRGPQPAALAALASADVAAAATTIGKQKPLADARYFAALVRSISSEWLILGGCSKDASHALPGWLGNLFQERDATRGRATVASAARRTNKPAKGAKSAKRRPVNNRHAPDSAAEKARQRWLVPAGFASQNFAGLAARLLALQTLQASFAERLEIEKLEALAEFAAGAGHEINNPLAVISGRAQLFMRHERDPERRRELAVINTQARRVHEMIADLMLFARPPEPRLAECDVIELIDNVATELESSAVEAGVQISIEVADGLPKIQADATQLQVALRAVCENALEALAGRGNGRIEITAATSPPPFQGGAGGGSSRSELPGSHHALRSENAPKLMLAIRDNGSGMSPEVRRHAFDPYFSGRGAGRGLGNGLSKCWRIVTGHGGSVEIDSTPAGTSVTMLLSTDTSGADVVSTRRS